MIVLEKKYSFFESDKNIAALDFISEYVKDEETKLGASCNQLQADTMSYFYNSIEPMMIKGKKGGDWWNMIDQNMVNNLIKHEENMMECWVIYSSVEKYEEFKSEVNYNELFEIMSGIKTIVMYTDFNVIDKEKFDKKYIYLEKYYIRWKALRNKTLTKSNADK